MHGAIAVKLDDEVRAGGHLGQDMPRQPFVVRNETGDLSIAHHAGRIGAGPATKALFLLLSPGLDDLEARGREQRQPVQTPKQPLVIALERSVATITVETLYDAKAHFRS